MTRFDKILGGGDLRSIGRSDEVVGMIQDQNDFDQLFPFLFHPDRVVAGRTADAIEKLTIENPGYLSDHKKEVLTLLDKAKDIELKWHLALLVPRVDLNTKELDDTWKVLRQWAENKKESRIVRVNAMQSLYDLQQLSPEYRSRFYEVINVLEKENIPSITSRIRLLRKKGM
ncbi:hypothetical protein [Zeaxanthinibacter enoshimensis]|uniref:HEAT repeat protein n=1 Tax=Zeaxanthinibacter enoshimensis TaxID=392009 RepID=A0A4R6TNF7_9FLAO|nr:hypothetical protein [Zeaxanthinibacter enoshimensis]TDQ33054.1 hypothetical protein CLV82_0892 [Zeaxanthinibacter enoshimensis]